jgi:hypothetical protein
VARRKEAALLASARVDYYTKIERDDLRGSFQGVPDALARGLEPNEAEANACSSSPVLGESDVVGELSIRAVLPADPQHVTEGSVQLSPGGIGLPARTKEADVDIPSGLCARVAELLGHEFDACSLIDEDAGECVAAGVRGDALNTRSVSCGGKRLSQPGVAKRTPDAVADDQILIRREPSRELARSQQNRELAHHDHFALPRLGLERDPCAATTHLTTDVNEVVREIEVAPGKP